MEGFNKRNEGPKGNSALSLRLYQRMLQGGNKNLWKAAGLVPPDEAEEERLDNLSPEELDAELDRLGVPPVSKEAEDAFLKNFELALDEHYGTKD